MRKPITLMFLAMLCLSVAFYRPLRDHLRTGFNATKEKISEENEEGEEKENEGAREEMQLAKQFGSWFQSRAYPDPKGINQKYWAGWEQAEALRQQQSAYRGNGMQ